MSDDKAIEKALGARLRQLRKARRMSQEAVGAPLGLSHQQIQKYEAGGNRISVSTFIRICKVLDYDPAVIVGPLAKVA